MEENVKIRKVDTTEYVNALRAIIDEGKEVSMMLTGNSMSPFLIHQRDSICFRKSDRDPVKGDMVFYQRPGGQYVMHRVWKRTNDGYYIVGDAQTQIEGPVRREQIFAVITKVRRKGKWIKPGDFWWEFFAHIWIRMVPVRRTVMKLYAKIIK